MPLETPLPLTQAVGSPIPPPRQGRQNPFNRPEANNPHQRSHSMRSAPGMFNYLNFVVTTSLIYVEFYEFAIKTFYYYWDVTFFLLKNT